MLMDYIKSPMNYTGGKYKILRNIIPSFPSEINKFVDLFAGGFNVGINIQASTIYANDQIPYIIDLYSFFQDTPTDLLIKKIKNKIAFYELSQTNIEGYKELRSDYNKTKSILDLFVLTCYSFNHQIRYNNKHEFNTPFGRNRSSFNDNIERNLIAFCDALHKKNIIFSSVDFRNFNFNILSKGDVVYCDPPYLITTGSYNDGTRGFKDWKAQDDEDLFSILDNLNGKGILFALSNVLMHKGKTNESLIEWSKKYKVSYIDKTYSNCSYHFKDRESKTIEVLITNYNWEETKCEQMSLTI